MSLCHSNPNYVYVLDDKCFHCPYRTTRNLHTHLHEAPLTKKHFQVTGYGIVSSSTAQSCTKMTVNFP